ncbi:hypothetical protein HKI81_03935 [Caldanaerobacter subterraneus]|uniref:Uncharacterized protein n=2 Tax=Caldanaerobacter subterraneus TaxID=911092 RepID=A0A7Y2L5X0_9THEO|nr:hypothetical protein [Caldanaerobacter subterraneus]
MNDDQIITPFKYKKSMQIPDRLGNIPDFEYIMFLISKGAIREREIEILEMLKKFRFLTTSQIRRLLGLEEYDRKLKKKLDVLQKNRIVFRFSWLIDDKPSVMKGFCLDVLGYKILNDYLGEEFEWKMEDNLKPMEVIFSHFMFNEIVIRAKKSPNYVDSFLSDKHIGTGIIIMEGKSGKKPYVVLVLRKSDKWENKFKERLGDIVSFLSNGWQSFYESKPIFIILGEDKEHITAIAQIIVDMSGSIDTSARLGIKYTTDDFIMRYPLTEAFANIDVIDGELVVNRVIAKIFGEEEV